MPKSIEFRVYDIPRPGGSKKAFIVNGRACVTEAGRHTKAWRQAVKVAAMTKYEGPLLDGPLALRVTFFMRRPKSHYRTGKHAGELKPNAPKWHAKQPDTTKLLRSTEDALTGVIWRDDSQVVFQTAGKKYGEKPGALITVEQMSDSA